MWKWSRNLRHFEMATLANGARARQNLRRILEHAQHLVAILDEELVALELQPVRILNRLAHLDAQHHILRMGVVFAQVVTVIRSHHRQPKIFLQLEQRGMDEVLLFESLILNLEEEILSAKKIAILCSRSPRRIVAPFH